MKKLYMCKLYNNLYNEDTMWSIKELCILFMHNYEQDERVVNRFSGWSECYRPIPTEGLSTRWFHIIISAPATKRSNPLAHGSFSAQTRLPT